MKLTDARLAHLPKNVPEALYALSDGPRVVDKAVDSFRGLLRIDVERRVVYICIE